MSEVLLTSSDTEEEDADEEYEEEASEEIPASLLSYFEASRRRAAACEKLILEDLEYLTASQCNEPPAQANFAMVDKDTKTTNEMMQADTSDEQNEDNRASSGSYADEQEFSTVPGYRHDVGGSELQLDMERRKREEQDFEKELQRMKAAGKLRQKEADMTEVKAREELEREFRLQQELLNDMKRQVEEEVKKRDEEQRRLAQRQKEEEEKRKRGQDEDRWNMVQGTLKEEEEKNEESQEANRKQIVEEEERRKKEEEVKRRKETESKPKEEVEMTRGSEEDDKRRKHVEEEQEMKVKREEVEARRKQTEEEVKRRTDEDDEGHKQLQEEPTVNKEEEERWEKAERKLKEEKEMEVDKRKLADRRGKVEKEVEKRRTEQEEEIANWGEEGGKRKREAGVMQMQEEAMGKKEDEKGTSKKAVSRRQEEEGKVRRLVEKEESRREETKGRAIEDDEKKKRGEPMNETSQNTEEKEKKKREAVRKKEEKAKWRKEEEEKKRSEQMEEEASSKMKDVEVETRRKQEETEKSAAEEVKKDLEQECEKKGERRRRRTEEEEESDGMGRGEERMDKMEGEATECEERRKKIEEAERRSPESAEGEKSGKELEMKKEEGWEKSSIEAETPWKEDKETRTREEEGRTRANEEHDRWRCEKENQRTEEVEKRKKNEEGGRSEELQRKCAEDEERKKSDDIGVRKGKEKMEVKERMGEDEKRLEEEKSEEQRMKQKDEKMRREEEERKNMKKSDESTDEEDENEEPLTKNQRQRDASDPNIQQSITENIHENIHHNSSGQSCLSRLMDQRRLSWMEVRVPWSEMENRSRRTSSFASRRESRRSGQDHDLPPLCPNTLLGAAGRSSLLEVTILVLEDLPGCSLSTLAQCTRLQSLTMRRCGLKVLEGISRLADLCYVDVPENEISRLDCEDMTGLRVLKMSCNKLTSIHGLSGAENLHILELSHNSIARIAGLDSLRRLQRLSLDHNQLVSTKGLKDVCTLLHLDCSYNHLARVEGLESNVLLRTLDLTSNSLSEPPVLQDHVLLGELHIDDNSLASLRHLFSASWLPQLHTLTLAHNRLTHLPDMSAAVSLANLDLRFNCLSDVQDVCRSLEGCFSLDEVHLAGNPLQRESGWRCTLQADVSSLRTIDGTDADILRTHSAVARQIDSGSGVLSLIRTQLHQMNDLQRQHAEQLSKVSQPLDAIKISCGHLMEALHLAKEQRRSLERAHVGPTSASWTTLEDSLDEVSPVASGTGCATPFCDVHASAVEGTRSSVQRVSHHQDWDLQSNSVASEVGGGYASYEGNPESAVQKSIIAQHHAATLIQAQWRGFSLRRRLAAALAAVTSLEDDDDAFEWVDVEEFVLDETTLEQGWTLCDDAPARCYSPSKQPLPGIYPEHSQLVLPPLPKQRLPQAWEVKEWEEKRVSPQSSNRKMSSSTSMGNDFSERSERILEEWGFTNRHTAELMLRRAQKMKSKQESAGPSGQLEAWRNQPLTTYQLERPNRLARRNRNATRVHQAKTGPGRVRWDRTREWLRNQNTLRHSESEHFLPNISADLVSGGRRRLLAPEAGRMENQATGVWACNNLLAQDCRENKNTVGLPVESVEQDIPTAWRKERISFRDEPVCRSSGWGGGKKRQKVKH